MSNEHYDNWSFGRTELSQGPLRSVRGKMIILIGWR